MGVSRSGTGSPGRSESWGYGGHVGAPISVSRAISAGPADVAAGVTGCGNWWSTSKALVDDASQVDVREVESQTVTIIELRVAEGDIGKVIGKQGRTARPIRTILNANATKLKKRAVLEIIE